MKSAHGKTYAFLLVAVMLLASIPFTVSIYDDDTEAMSVEESSRWYYNQLDAPMKYAYDKLLETNNGSKEVVVTIPEGEINGLYDDCVGGNSAKLKNSFGKLINCLHLERPDMYCSSATYKSTSSGKMVKNVEITFVIDDENTAAKNAAINNVIKSIGATTGTPDEKITKIHDYLVNLLTYATTELNAEKSSGVTNNSIRSPYKALVGDHRVVCEGYAKSFKMACDYYGIPCVMVVGLANNGNGAEGHMWNLVYVGNSWYTVDVTWDDPVGGSGNNLRHTYLLVGQNTKDDNRLTTAVSHNTSTTTRYGFSLPLPLAPNKYGGDDATINFSTYGGTAISPMTVKVGSTPTIPTTVRNGYTFGGWYLDSRLTEKWNNTPITGDVTLHAKWIADAGTVVTYVVTYDNNGGQGGPGSISTDATGVTKISSAKPTKEGFSFNGWNTAKNGSGTAYKGGETITISQNLTLYAQWSDAPIKEGTLDTIKETFDKFLDKTKEFMDEEMIDGVKNLYVVVGGAAVFLLIAVLAMRR